MTERQTDTKEQKLFFTKIIKTQKSICYFIVFLEGKIILSFLSERQKDSKTERQKYGKRERQEDTKAQNYCFQRSQKCRSMSFSLKLFSDGKTNLSILSERRKDRKTERQKDSKTKGHKSAKITFYKDRRNAEVCLSL